MNIRERKLKIALTSIFLLFALPIEGVNLLDQSFPQDSKPDLIILDANVITMESQGPSYTSIVVKDGIIVELSNSSFIEEQLDTDIKKIYLDGKTILPGFIDSHSHWIGDRNLLSFTFDEAIASALSNGWTSISEQFVNQDRLNELIQMDNENRLKLRVNAYLPINYEEQRFGEWYQAYQPHQLMSENVRIGGVKLFMDNGPTFTERTYHFTPEELNPIVKTAHDLGYQISIHSIAHNATDMALDALDAAQGDNTAGNFRHKIEHASMLRSDQLLRLLEMKTTVSAQLLWYTSDWTEWVEDDFAGNAFDELTSYFARWRDVIDIGIHFIGSTDTPWIDQEIGSSIVGLYSVTTRIGSEGLTPPQWMLDQRISIEEAIKAITVDAAYSTFQEDEKGTLKAGKLADFTVLSQNPLNMASEDLLELEIDMTLVGGGVMHCNVGMDEQCGGIYDVASSDLWSKTDSLITSDHNTSSSESGSRTFYDVSFGVFIMIIIIRIVHKKRFEV